MTQTIVLISKQFFMQGQPAWPCKRSRESSGVVIASSMAAGK